MELRMATGVFVEGRRNEAQPRRKPGSSAGTVSIRIL